MATPSAKHATFASRSIKGVGVGDVPGIGDKSKERLSKEKITKVRITTFCLYLIYVAVNLYNQGLCRIPDFLGIFHNH